MAVYTEVADDQLVPFVASYGLGELKSCKGIAEGVENSNYLIETTRGRFILTLYEKRVAPTDLPFFLGLMEHLAAQGFDCPTPVRDAIGRNLRQLAGRPAAIVTFLDGLSVRRPDAEHCAAAGQALARLHRAGQGFAIRRENALGPLGWRPLFERFSADADRVQPGLHILVRDTLDELLPRWPAGLPAGVIHADMFPDTVFFRAGTLTGVIDFYFACNDALAYDIAVSLNAWCFEPDFSFNITKGRALLAGYERVRRLAAEEIAALPTLAAGAALRFLLTRAYDWLNTPKDALVRPHDPNDYVRRLRFHRSVRTAADYGHEAAR
jgi:homoserine kinase type II